VSLFRRKPCTNCADARDAVYASLETISGLKRELHEAQVQIFALRARQTIWAQLLDLSSKNPPRRGESRIDTMCNLLKSNPRIREVFEGYVGLLTTGSES